MRPQSSVLTQVQDERQWQESQLHNAVGEAEYAEWATARDAEEQIKFEHWLETPTGIDWITQVIRPRKEEWTLDEFIASPEGKAWIYGQEEATSGPSWID